MIHDEMYYGDFPSDPEFEELEHAYANRDQYGWDEGEAPVRCHDMIVRYDGTKWYCPQCNRTWNREEWFEKIGAILPSDECKKCIRNYPECKGLCWMLEEDELDL